MELGRLLLIMKHTSNYYGGRFYIDHIITYGDTQMKIYLTHQKCLLWGNKNMSSSLPIHIRNPNGMPTQPTELNVLWGCFPKWWRERFTHPVPPRLTCSTFKHIIAFVYIYIKTQRIQLVGKLCLIPTIPYIWPPLHVQLDPIHETIKLRKKSI